jgi:hypothetical protein
MGQPLGHDGTPNSRASGPEHFAHREQQDAPDQAGDRDGDADTLPRSSRLSPFRVRPGGTKGHRGTALVRKRVDGSAAATAQRLHNAGKAEAALRLFGARWSERPAAVRPWTEHWRGGHRTDALCCSLTSMRRCAGTSSRRSGFKPHPSLCSRCAATRCHRRSPCLSARLDRWRESVALTRICVAVGDPGDTPSPGVDGLEVHHRRVVRP